MTRVRGLAAGAMLLALGAGPALADGLALLVGNRAYAHAAWMYGAERALDNARMLERRGFVVVSGRDIRSGEIAQALGEIEDRLADADRIVIHLNGHFVHSANLSWFVPVDLRTPSLATVGRHALSVETVLAMAASKPGGAVVLLGSEPRRIALGAGLEPGLGTLAIPQGVTVVTGPPGALADFLSGSLMEPGTSLAEAAAQAPDGVT
ncbi:MAG: hypothetical protein D6811_12955, partial [Alphaproteobacteria bacterium]